MNILFHGLLLFICLTAESYRLYEKLSTLYSKETALFSSLILITLIVYFSFYDKRKKLSFITLLISMFLGVLISVNPLYDSFLKATHPEPKQKHSYPEKPKEPKYEAGNRSEYSEKSYLYNLWLERKNYPTKLNEWKEEKRKIDLLNRDIEKQNLDPEIKIDPYDFSIKVSVSLIFGLLVPFGVYYTTEKVKESLLNKRNLTMLDNFQKNEFQKIEIETESKLQQIESKILKISDIDSKNLVKDKNNLAMFNKKLAKEFYKNGMRKSEIAEYFKVSERTIYNWLR